MRAVYDGLFHAANKAGASRGAFIAIINIQSQIKHKTPGKNISNND